MPLFVVATPIGDPDDISVRAIRTLQTCDVVIGEEGKVVRAFLKHHSIPFQNLGAPVPNAKTIELLNEHSTKKDVDNLLELCRSQNVALVSDCGTPGFCDPGADLVNACYRAQIKVTPVPGSSSLMTLLSVCGQRLNEFLFIGFLPANNEERDERLRVLAKEPRALIIMDTPYRLDKTINDLAKYFPNRWATLGLNLTQANEQIVRGKIKALASQSPWQKSEFVVLISPEFP